MIAHITSDQKKETVWEHSVKTMRKARELGKTCGMEYLAGLAALIHDMGKGSKLFLKYIQCVSGGQSWNRAKVNHSSAGARWIAEHYPGKTAFEKLTTEMIAWSVMSHHGVQDIVSIDGVAQYDQRIRPDQEICYEEVVRNFFRECDMNMDVLYQKAALEVKAYINRLGGKSNSELRFCLGMLMRLLLSILIDSDRYETAMFMSGAVREPEPDSGMLWDSFILKIEDRIMSFRESKIEDRGRKELYLLRDRISLQCLKQSVRSTGIYTLQVPTGGGKSLASMRFALHHAKEHHLSRIFYIAPFRTILEQTAETYRNLFQMENAVLEHHSDILVEKDDEETQALIERWASPVILTTFVQFLNTLFSHRTQSVRRMHTLMNSVIIVDEVQSLPIKAVSLFNCAMNFLKQMNTTIILCSATQPLLAQTEHPLSVDGAFIENAEELFRKMRRTRMLNFTYIHTAEKICDLACEKLLEQSCGLIILNTRAAAKRVYEELAERNLPNTTIIYLSTFMCAQHRIDRLEEFREKLKESRETQGREKVVCVSTQLIEAGVDLSADWVIRSTAGWDSLIQASGRCNREAMRELGDVYLVKCDEEKLGSLQDIRQGQQISERLLRQYFREGQEDISESPWLIDEYYRYYFFEKKAEMDYPIERGFLKTTILDLLSSNSCGLKNSEKNPLGEKAGKQIIHQAFREAGQQFRVIETDTQAVLVPYRKGKDYIEQLNSDIRYEEIEMILRMAQRYTVNAREGEIRKYLGKGKVYKLHSCEAYALLEDYYQECGVTEDAELQALFM